MKLLSVIEGATLGAGVGVALGFALPFFGPIGVLTATGLRVFSTAGALAGAADSIQSKSSESQSSVSRLPFH